ncbi:MAG TPA: hypothetical protein EYH45_03045 [Candidatus Caldiarchaeum subterraneum]|uniref:Uncharacterized protein n=1 Tax=Caldiarchaeum subterraneum TaxID=311458 RepID=A0A833EAA2_CALS0|nr:hypothetical protein [Candidatus Caldarchaeum subterraneum]
MGPLWIVNIIISLLIIVSLLYVLKTFVHTRSVVRSRLVNALIIFTVVFIIQNLFAVYLYFDLAESYSADMAYQLLILNLLGLTGFSIFVYVARH